MSRRKLPDPEALARRKTRPPAGDTKPIERPTPPPPPMGEPKSHMHAWQQYIGREAAEIEQKAGIRRVAALIARVEGTNVEDEERMLIAIMEAGL